MFKWSHLVEGRDSELKAAQRAYAQNPSDQGAVMRYAQAIRRSQARGARSDVLDWLMRAFDNRQSRQTAEQLIKEYDMLNGPAEIRQAVELMRNPPPNPGHRFTRLLNEFRNERTAEKAEALLADARRLQRGPDRYISETCELRGKSGNVCRQANQREVTTRDFVILISYQTPVAYVVRETGEEAHTRQRHSQTTTAHVSRWTTNQSKPVSQRELDEIGGGL